MARLIARKAAEGILVVFLVVTITFVLIHAAPGDPFIRNMDAARLTPEAREQLRRNAGLDKPLPVQYGIYLKNLVTGDAGTSFAEHSPVRTVIGARLANTVLLAGTALFMDFLIGIAAGIWQASRVNSTSDRIASVITLVLNSTPTFWLGMMMIMMFAVGMGVLPVGGVATQAVYDSLSLPGKVWDRLSHLAMPAATLALIGSGATARYQRASMIEALSQSYITAARARGISERAVILKHAFRNSLLPIITIFGLSFPVLLSGSVLVESVFGWPGMGQLAVNSVAARDYYVVMAIAIVSTTMVVTGNLIADVLYRVADPRTRSR